MHYNQFTIDYVQAIKRNLKIEFNENGKGMFSPDLIKHEDLINLRNELETIWGSSKSAISIIQQKHDSNIQSALFGLVNEFDTALKIGFLISDRVVLIDYLYERILLRKDPKQIDIVHLGVIANSLVSALPLARQGRIVIIPNPFNWNSEMSKIVNEVSSKAMMTTDLISLLSVLSITKSCKLHPYTIAESNNRYQAIIDNQIDHVDVIGQDGGRYAYDGILGALLTEKLLTGSEFKVALDIPLSKYFDIIASKKEFYLKYLTRITAGGSLSAQNNVKELTENLQNDIIELNKRELTNMTKAITVTEGIGSGVTAIAAFSMNSAVLTIASAALALSTTLTGLINWKESEEHSVISVFTRLYSTGMEYSI
jgi:hypothetical protein